MNEYEYERRNLQQTNDIESKALGKQSQLVIPKLFLTIFTIN